MRDDALTDLLIDVLALALVAGAIWLIGVEVFDVDRARVKDIIGIVMVVTFLPRLCGRGRA
jgi:hypothetical protein